MRKNNTHPDEILPWQTQHTAVSRKQQSSGKIKIQATRKKYILNDISPSPLFQHTLNSAEPLNKMYCVPMSGTDLYHFSFTPEARLPSLIRSSTLKIHSSVSTARRHLVYSATTACASNLSLSTHYNAFSTESHENVNLNRPQQMESNSKHQYNTP